MLTDDDTTPFFQTADGHGDARSNTDKHKRPRTLYTNLPFIYFVIATILLICCALLNTAYSDIAYIICGIIGVAISLFGIKHFHTLIHLTVTVNDFSKLNHTFKTERNHIKHSVNALSNARGDLNETHNRLVIANKRNRENLTQFRGIQENMEIFNATSLEQLQEVVNRSKNVEQRWHDELYRHERSLLHTVFDRFAHSQLHCGVNRKEFDEFSLQLPASYQERFSRMGTFDKLADNKDMILLEDFEKTLDIFAEMQANDCDIDFHIQSTTKRRKVNPKKSLKKRKTTYNLIKKERSRASSITKYIDDNDDMNNVDDDDDRKYDNNLITYQRQVIITRRSTPGQKLPPSDLAELRAAASSGLTPTTPWGLTPTGGSPTLTPGSIGSPPGFGRGLHRTATRFKNAFITDLTAITELNALPDIEYMRTDDIEQYNFTEQQMDTYMGALKEEDT